MLAQRYPPATTAVWLAHWCLKDAKRAVDFSQGTSQNEVIVHHLSRCTAFLPDALASAPGGQSGREKTIISRKKQYSVAKVACKLAGRVSRRLCRCYHSVPEYNDGLD